MPASEFEQTVVGQLSRLEANQDNMKELVTHIRDRLETCVTEDQCAQTRNVLCEKLEFMRRACPTSNSKVPSKIYWWVLAFMSAITLALLGGIVKLVSSGG